VADLAADRHFLFLQGPHGTFFARLGVALGARGHAVTRVNLCGGDRLDWSGAGAVDYRGRARDWPDFAERLMRGGGVTDLVLFGDCRPYHLAVREPARRLGVRVHVLEEGYIRPDHVTVERDGVNGHSSLPRDPARVLALASDLPPVPPPAAVPSSFGYRARRTLAHALATGAGRWRFPCYRTHRPALPAAEALGWALRRLGRATARRRTARAWNAVRGRSFFLLPLQLDGDPQLSVHSPFPGMADALERVVTSFAAHAPPDAHLLVKRHPLDGSLTDWAARVARAAKAGRADARVHYLPGMDVAELVAAARGVVTVNSTVGTLALNAGVPVCVLGEAVYAVPGLVHADSLDSFWQAPELPDAVLWDAFRRVLLDRCLVPGGYGSDEGVALLVEGVAERLLRERAWD